MRKLKAIPKFKNEEEERKFWATADSSLYFDLSKGARVLFPHLKPTTESISIRVPQYLLAQIKELAHAKDIPYQSLIKVFLSERVREEWVSERSK